MRCPKCRIEMRVRVTGKTLAFLCRNANCSGYGRVQAEKKTGG